MRFLPPKSKQVDCAPLRMNVLHVATITVGMMLLAHSAAAQSSAPSPPATCMCAETGLELPLSVDDLDAAAVQDALDAQGASSADGVDAKALPSDGSDDLPWCTSQNQAECSKRPIGSTPSPVSIGTSAMAATAGRLALPSLTSSIACDFAEYSSGGPRDAVRSKLERPPQ